eukprot:RCo031431
MATPLMVALSDEGLCWKQPPEPSGGARSGNRGQRCQLLIKSVKEAQGTSSGGAPKLIVACDDRGQTTIQIGGVTLRRGGSTGGEEPPIVLSFGGGSSGGKSSSSSSSSSVRGNGFCIDFGELLGCPI